MRVQSIILLLTIFTFFSCTKEAVDVITIEGVLLDRASRQPIPGVSIIIDGVKSSSSWGIITDGKRETVGRTATNASGYYQIKMRIFKEAERLEFHLNQQEQREGYVAAQESVDLAALSSGGTNKTDFLLSPTALLKIRFKNTSPVSNADFFYFNWFYNGGGWTKGVLQRENCGSVVPSQALTWTGMDVCGVFTAETIAEQTTQLSWTVKKAGITNNYYDSIYVNRGVVNEYILNY